VVGAALRIRDPAPTSRPAHAGPSADLRADPSNLISESARALRGGGLRA
jgi:hypothetical protein